MKKILLLGAGLVGLAACQSNSSPGNTTAPRALATPPGAPTDTAATVASSPGASYRVFRGQVAGRADSVTLHLVTAPGLFFGLAGRLGCYGSYYGTDGHPYGLQSQPTAAPDSLVLNDTSPEHDRIYLGASPAWRLQQQPAGGLAGTVGGQAVRLRLVPAPAGGLSFAVRCFADSLAALPKDARSPKARFVVQALLPTGGPASPRTALTTNFLRDLRGDSAATQAPLSLAALYQQQREAFFKDYREEAADLPAPTDTADVGSYRASLNYESQAASYVLFREGELLSVAYFNYDFTGGAHGNYGTTVASYDLRTGRRLHYDDIFQPTAAARLPALLAAAVRPLVGLQPSEPLDKALLVRKLPVTHNVFLTAGGVAFVYQPYEIASYAQGEVRVFLPLGQVRALLREGLPVPGAAGVAVQQRGR